MTGTEQLIASLAHAKPPPPMGSPVRLALRIGLVLAVYALLAFFLLKPRADLAVQLTRGMFLAELGLLALTCMGSVFASACLAFPDSYQQKAALRFPFIAAALFALLLLIEGVLPPDVRIAVPSLPESMQCTLCIAVVAVLPSALIFWLLRHGASVRPFLAGMLAVLAATSVGCLLLRLIEDNDSLVHLITYHYLPTLAFAALGAILGKYLLRW